MAGRRRVYEYALEPGTGKAVPVLRGQILRVEQLGNGQCADFNAFNLHDYREHFHAGRTRVTHGLFPTTGDMLWSAPPRERPMYTIIGDTVGTNDVSYPRCTGVFYEAQFGFETHTNCQDIQAEAQREYGLTPDDVHDSFNIWMHTAVDDAGRLLIKPQLAKRGDYIELIAHFDTLAVVNVCGADVTWTSNFELKPLMLLIDQAGEEEAARWLLPTARKYRNQRTPREFIASDIKSTRELTRDPRYAPAWPTYPVRTERIEVALAREEYRLVCTLRARRIEFGDEDGAILRSVFFAWWNEVRMPPNAHGN